MPHFLWRKLNVWCTYSTSQGDQGSRGRQGLGGDPGPNVRAHFLCVKSVKVISYVLENGLLGRSVVIVCQDIRAHYN